MENKRPGTPQSEDDNDLGKLRAGVWAFKLNSGGVFTSWSGRLLVFNDPDVLRIYKPRAPGVRGDLSGEIDMSRGYGLQEYAPKKITPAGHMFHCFQFYAHHTSKSTKSEGTKQLFVFQADSAEHRDLIMKELEKRMMDSDIGYMKALQDRQTDDTQRSGFNSEVVKWYKR
ncbi:hypothetical protein CYMTET_17308 [Cymbomonas tetramitiformis]|uniref:Uncharacterized protein n=1 Tax=Cymbomonas tetramitiformis TaxID=36881 RepID=A0AAE0GAK4_9CHLO|nr:hypothetical protein CYMTET_17308 [Cymbomonas tetramitiformis]